MQYTIYKNEFNAIFVEFITRKFEVSYDSKTRATLEGVTEEDCEKIAACMYVNDEQCIKVYFPEYMTINEEADNVIEAVKAAHTEMLNAFCKFINSPANKAAETMDDEHREKYNAMRELVLQMSKVLR